VRREERGERDYSVYVLRGLNQKQRYCAAALAALQVLFFMISSLPDVMTVGFVANEVK